MVVTRQQLQKPASLAGSFGMMIITLLASATKRTCLCDGGAAAQHTHKHFL
jgi:hypothetical protein